MPCVTRDSARLDRPHCHTASNHWYRVATEQLKTIARMKRSLAHRSRVARVTREELKDSQEEAADIQQRLEASDAELQRTRRELERFKGWWVNEYCFVKILLQMVPDPEEVDAIAESSHGRFARYCELHRRA